MTISGISSPAPEAVYLSARQGTFSYTIPGFAANSIHTLRLHFAELYFSTTGSRVFNVSINGKQVLTNFDIVAAAGGGLKAIAENFSATANASGQFVISFTNGTRDQPMANGIEVQ